MQIAVIGAGIAGLTCARQLQANGHHVTVYEQADHVSGRMATRQTEMGGFDHGAQYFTARSKRFKKEVADWCKFDWVGSWDSKIVHLEAGRTRAASDLFKRYVAIPGMGALGQQLAHGLDVRLEQRITALSRHENSWLLSVRSDEAPIAATAGPFDKVVLAIPAPQAFALTQGLSEISHALSNVKLSPCWSLLLAFQSPLSLKYDAAWVEQSRLSWIARDTAKPAHRAGERWVAHASPEWSQEHLQDDPERVKDKLCKAFHEATACAIRPVYAHVHLWPYAQALHPLDGDCLLDAGTGLGVCGDWFLAGLEGGSRVENAFLSAEALAASLS